MKLKLCKCGRQYTCFSICMKCFIDFVDKMNEGKVLLKPILKQHSRHGVEHE